MKYKFKKHLQDLTRERAGGYRKAYSKSLYLDRNERVLPYDDETLARLYKRMSEAPLHLYPDVESFYRKLSHWLGIKEDRIYLTEGVSGAIKSLIETIAESGDNIVFPTPTFALYPIYCQMFDLEYRTLGYTEDYELDVDKMLSLIDKKTSIVFLPNPNVPIEGTLDVKALMSLAGHCLKNNTFLAFDEVYYPFGGPTAIDLIDRFDNVFVMRSFSKAFGLAGIRLGYLLGAPKNIEYVSKIRTGYESNTASMETASFFIDNYRLVEDYIHSVKEGLAYLKREFDKLGLEYNGGNASNFIYVNMHHRALARKVVSELKKKNIHIRNGWAEPYSAGFVVTAAPKALMEKFIKELSFILSR